MKRKMLIVIALVIVMLFDCIAPMLQAQAATAKTTMTFNLALYKGLKSYFQEQGISAIYNDGLHTIKMEQSTIDKIEELSLKEKGISNITGLDVFTNVKSLILSGNDLDETSNLSVLNNFANLTYLDISSNQISDVTEIQPLVERLIASNSNAINLTGQNAKVVIDVSLKSSEDRTRVTYQLPQILQFAGIAENGTIKNKGELKDNWISEVYSTNSSVSPMAPYIDTSTIPNPVTDSDNSFEIVVGKDQAGLPFTQYQGLIKWVISIKDTDNVSYNINPASNNMLKDSIFTLYYVIHVDGYEGVIFKDNNLYVAVRDQLRKGQTINNNLLSYSYSTDENGDTYYDVCDLSLNGSRATLKIGTETVYIIDNFNQSGNDGRSVIYKADGRTENEIQEYEIEYVDTISNSGVVTRTLKVKVPHYNADSRQLFIDSYDEPYALVISDLDIVNKITSLILNDKRIMDLSGLEKFIGLESNLNVSYNYIDTLANIYALELNKQGNNGNLQELFNSRKSSMANYKSKVKTAYSTVSSNIKLIREKIDEIQEIITVDYPALDASAEGYVDAVAELVNRVNEANKAIYGDGTDNNIGYVGEINKALNHAQDGLNINLSRMYQGLSSMYNVYNKEYKLTSLLIPELNYQTEEEYEAYLEKVKTKESVAELVNSEVARISSFESAGAISALEKELIRVALGLSYDSNETYPITKALNDLVSYLTQMDASRTAWKTVLDNLMEVNIYSQAANYCLLERMNNATATQACYVERYLAERIKEFNYEGIDTELLTAIYEKLSEDKASTVYNQNLLDVFVRYENSSRSCETGISAYFCKDKYYNVTKLDYEFTTTNATLGSTTVTYPSQVKVTETLTTLGKNTGTTYLYYQLMNLANKFTAVDEVDRYVVLPELMRIDVRNNQIESLGDTEVTMVKEDGTKETTTETLATLTRLRELYAGHNLVSGEITNVDWTTLQALKKLDLSYNFITDISPLQVLKNLRYLDVSDNLLEGEFNLSLKAMPKIKDVKLAGNQYTDISKILTDYEFLAGGNFTDYFAREDTLNIDLSRQNIELDISDAIAYADDTNVYEVELPPIFAQLEFIDATRTAYGTTSSKGTITAKGGYAYVPVTKTGEYVGLVKVIAANGYPEDVTTSIGIDSTCTIKYSVKNIKVDSVKISGESTRMEAGSSRTFTAKVTGENVPDKTVEWDIVSEHKEGTTISQEGKLQIAADETATQLVIEATSNYDDGVKDTITIEVYRRTVTGVTVTGPNALVTGKTGEYTAQVAGTDLKDTDKGVTWSISGNTSSNTKLEEIVAVEGEEIENVGGAKLTLGADETADKVTVTATSTYDNTKSKSIQVTVKQKKVTGITITGDAAIRTGNTGTYTVQVAGENLEDADKAVEWSIIRPYYADEYSANTKLEEIVAVEGEEIENVGGAKLTIGQDEVVRTFTIRARSKFDGTKYKDFEVTVNKKEVTAVNIVNPTEAIVTGKSAEYTAEVTGNFLDDADKAVIWSISGLTSDKTKVELIKTGEKAGGAKLTIGSDETSDKVKLKAESKLDSRVFAEYEVTVNKKAVTSVKVYEQGQEVTLDGRGKTLLFTEVVEGNYLDKADKGITWSVSGNNSQSTRITDTGILIVAEDETANQVTVTATSKFDKTKKGTSVVTISRKGVTSVVVNEQDRTVRKGGTLKFTATVEGNKLEASDKGVTWSVAGNAKAGTTISEEGLLKIASDETATTLTVTATSKANNTVSGTSTVTISTEASLPTLGYTVDGDGDIVGVSPDTKCSTFKSKLVTDNTYTVSVKRNGTEVAANTAVATGDIVTISKNGQVLEVYEVVVKGDINGDGTVDVSDTKLVKAHNARLITLEGLSFKAADINNDKSVDSSDLKLNLAHRAKLDGYIL